MCMYCIIIIEVHLLGQFIHDYTCYMIVPVPMHCCSGSTLSCQVAELPSLSTWAVNVVV